MSMDAETEKRASQIMDPNEFKRLLDQFGRQALAKAEIKGRNAAVAEMVRIIVKSRMPGSTKEWLQDQCRNLAKPPV